MENEDQRARSRFRLKWKRTLTEKSEDVHYLKFFGQEETPKR